MLSIQVPKIFVFYNINYKFDKNLLEKLLFYYLRLNKKGIVSFILSKEPFCEIFTLSFPLV